MKEARLQLLYQGCAAQPEPKGDEIRCIMQAQAWKYNHFYLSLRQTSITQISLQVLCGVGCSVHIHGSQMAVVCCHAMKNCFLGLFSKMLLTLNLTR